MNAAMLILQRRLATGLIEGGRWAWGGNASSAIARPARASVMRGWVRGRWPSPSTSRAAIRP